MNPSYTADGAHVLDAGGHRVATADTPALARRIALTLSACSGVPDDLLAAWGAVGLHARLCVLERVAEQVLDAFDGPASKDSTAALLGLIDGPLRVAVGAVSLDRRKGGK